MSEGRRVNSRYKSAMKDGQQSDRTLLLESLGSTKASMQYGGCQLRSSSMIDKEDPRIWDFGSLEASYVGVVTLD